MLRNFSLIALLITIIYIFLRKSRHQADVLLKNIDRL